jgi:hypothetical protein
MSIAHGLNGNWVVLGKNSDGANNIYYSNDNGASWNATLAVPGVGAFASIAYGNGIFVATATTSAGNAVYRSTDGTGQTWVSVGLSGLGIFVQYSNGRWVVGGLPNVDTNNIVYSSNGISWSGQRILGGSNVYQVRYGDGKWVATGYTFNTQSAAYSNVEPICFLEGSKILTDKGYVPVEQLKVGDMVKTVNHGFVPIQTISTGKSNQLSLEKRLDYQLYVCPTKNFPEAFEDLVITGFHSMLVKEFPSEEEKKETQLMLSGLPMTDGYYLLPSRVDRRTEIYDKLGMHNIYHVCLECEDDDKNYGIYANGILVESISKNHLLTYGPLKVV